MRSPQILLIHQETEIWDELAAWMSQAGCCVSHAVGKTDALQTLYRIHPDLILLELFTLAESTWSLLARIRLYTETPVLVMAQHIHASDRSRQSEFSAVELVETDAGPDALLTAVSQHLKHLPRPAEAQIETTQPVSLSPKSPKNINMMQIAQVDRALIDIGDSGEVWLIKRDGQLRYIARVKTEPYKPAGG